MEPSPFDKCEFLQEIIFLKNENKANNLSFISSMNLLKNFFSISNFLK